MTSSDPKHSILAERIRSLRMRFRNGLPERLTAIRNLLATVDAIRVDELALHFHKLAGTAATYQFHEIAELAADAEALCGDYAIGPTLFAIVDDLENAVSEVIDVPLFLVPNATAPPGDEGDLARARVD